MRAFKFVKYGVFISLSDTKPVLFKPDLSTSCAYPHHTRSLSLSLTHTHTHTLTYIHTQCSYWADGKIVGCQPSYRL
jgi:hypothetical protein